jgi:coenzyme F420-reducing hydrogenase gamma subunit
LKRSFRKDFRIIFHEEKIGFKRNYLKNRGKTVVRLGQCNGENGAQRWVGAKRGDEIKKKKYTSYEEFGPKELKEYRKRFLMSRI